MATLPVAKVMPVICVPPAGREGATRYLLARSTVNWKVSTVRGSVTSHCVRSSFKILPPFEKIQAL